MKLVYSQLSSNNIEAFFYLKSKSRKMDSLMNFSTVKQTFFKYNISCLNRYW